MEIPGAVFLAICAGALIASFFVDGIPKIYRKRSCLGAEWRRRFPNASKQDIRQLLAFFTDAFAIKSKHALKFSPDDELLAIYRSRYPSDAWLDALELETLAMREGIPDQLYQHLA